MHQEHIPWQRHSSAPLALLASSVPTEKAMVSRNARQGRTLLAVLQSAPPVQRALLVHIMQQTTRSSAHLVHTPWGQRLNVQLAQLGSKFFWITFHL